MILHIRSLAASLAAGFLAGGVLISPAQAQEVLEERISTQYEDVRLVRIADGLENPWALAFLPDGRMLVTERAGRLLLIEADGSRTEVTGAPEVSARRQGGLLDVALHPRFADNGWVYLTYSKAGEDGTATALARGRLADGELRDTEDIFVQNRYSEPGRHYGSRLAFAGDGTLFMSIGDRGADPPRAQDLTDHAGSLLRLNDDGSVPDDNPFVHTRAAPEIYSYGLRNIQGMIVHPLTGAVWATDHGPRAGDELNLVRRGLNYGWPAVSHGLDYRTEEQIGMGRDLAGMEPPVKDWTPTLAPSGLAIYTGEQFQNWQGNLFAGGLRAQQIRRIVMVGHEVVHEEELLHGRIGRIRDVRQGPEGHLYVLTDETPGGLYRIEPAG